MDAIQEFYVKLKEEREASRDTAQTKPLALVVYGWSWGIFSRLLGERFLLVSNDKVKRSFADHPEVVYTFDEIKELEKLSGEGRDEVLQAVHLSKKELDGTVLEARNQLSQR